MGEPARKHTPLSPIQKNRLLRFIHTGYELPRYFPGYWAPLKYFKDDALPVINEVFKNGEGSEFEVIETIVKAYKDGWYTRFDTIAFALIKCIIIGNNNVKEVAYTAAIEICNTPEEMMLFNKFTRLYKTGNGRGWCRIVKAWYTNKEPMELAKEITRVRSHSGRNHKTLILKSHLNVKNTDYARDAVIKYALYGLKRTKQMIKNAEETKDILDYIQRVDDLRHCEDPVAAAEIIFRNRFKLEHLPGHLLTSKHVWDAILPQFTLEQLLYNILRIHNMGFLTHDSTTSSILIALLSNADIIKRSNVTPLAVYIAICNYKKKFRPMAGPKLQILLTKQKRRRERQVLDLNTNTWTMIDETVNVHPREIKNIGIDFPPNPEILCALSKLLEQTWLNTKPTGCRYMITMDMRHNMFKGRHFAKVAPFLTTTKNGKKTKRCLKAGGDAGDNDTQKGKKRLLAECFYHSNITPGHAALIVALHILKREKENEVTLAVFTEKGVHCISIERNFSTLEEAEFVFRQNPNLGRVQLDAPLKYATANKKEFDVFINLIDRPSRYLELEHSNRGGRGPGGRYGPPPAPNKGYADRCPLRALLKYRQEMKLPETKLITMSLASHRVATTDGTHEGVLDIIGIDEHVPKILDAFVLGQFK